MNPLTKKNALAPDINRIRKFTDSGREDRYPGILLLEDDPVDAELVQHILRHEGVIEKLDWVTDREEYLTALETNHYDIVLSDYRIPGFDGMSALGLLREHTTETRFIFVSGGIGEELAIIALKGGANDYVLKDNLKRLAPAVNRAWNELKLARRHKQVEDQLRQAEQRFQYLVASSPTVIY
ncbi:MAG: response regulator, partial [Gammaproteobacteria bacterium]|nr:response regulator [Gammaproteobacteria bacterium]